MIIAAWSKDERGHYVLLVFLHWGKEEGDTIYERAAS